MKALHICNELLIVTAPNAIFALLSKFILDNLNIKLINSDTSKKFNKDKKWKGDSTLSVNHEFFKRLRGLYETHLRDLARHFLNICEKKHCPYPKVIENKVIGIKEDTYRAGA